MITILAANLPAWLNWVDAGDGTAVLSGIPAAEDIGSHTVSLSARDKTGLTADQTFTIMVEEAEKEDPDPILNEHLMFISFLRE